MGDTCRKDKGVEEEWKIRIEKTKAKIKNEIHKRLR